MKTIATVLGLACFIFLCSEQPSRAGFQYTVHSGLDCVEHNDVSPDIWYSDGGNAWANDTLRMVCAIDRPNKGYCGTSPYCGLGVVWVYVYDGSDDESVGCRVFLNALGSNSYTSGSMSDSSSAGGTGFETLYLWGAAGSTYELYTYTLRCDVPAPDIDTSYIEGYLAYVH